MKTFKIPVSWEMYGYIEIEADSAEEAIEIFDQKESSMTSYNLPNGFYVDDSFQREEDIEFIIKFTHPNN